MAMIQVDGSSVHLRNVAIGSGSGGSVEFTGFVDDDTLIERCVLFGDLNLGSSWVEDAKIVDSVLWQSLRWTGGENEELRRLTVDGGVCFGIDLDASAEGAEIRDPMIRTRVTGWSATKPRVRVVGAVGGTVDVEISPRSSDFSAHTVELVDCDRLRLVGQIHGPDADDQDAVHIEGGERVIVRADVSGTGTTRSAVNIVSGNRHRVLGDLGAASDYDTAPVIDGGTATIDQSIID